jgi:hypothetical protein
MRRELDGAFTRERVVERPYLYVRLANKLRNLAPDREEQLVRFFHATEAALITERRIAPIAFDYVGRA